MKKISIIVGHPLKDSTSGMLAEAYKKGAEMKGAEVRILYLGDLKFDPILKNGYRQEQKWEPDLKMAVDDLLWADHWLFVTPIWWGAMPALLKGFIDRTFLSGIMYKYQSGSPLPIQLMKNKSAEVLATMDSPLVYYKVFMGRPLELLMRKSILGFCGVKPVKFNYFTPVRKADEAKKKMWEIKAQSLGERISTY